MTNNEIVPTGCRKSLRKFAGLGLFCQIGVSSVEYFENEVRSVAIDVSLQNFSDSIPAVFPQLEMTTEFSSESFGWGQPASDQMMPSSARWNGSILN